jgi:pilus assembly protein Flp/PilA
MKTLIKTLNASVIAFVKDEKGVAIIEYVLLAALIAVVLAASMTTLKTSIASVFTNIGTALSPATPTTP